MATEKAVQPSEEILIRTAYGNLPTLAAWRYCLAEVSSRGKLWSFTELWTPDSLARLG
jgi:hypothetical protein